MNVLHSKMNLAKLSNLMTCMNKLYLYNMITVLWIGNKNWLRFPILRLTIMLIADALATNGNRPSATTMLYLNKILYKQSSSGDFRCYGAHATGLGIKWAASPHPWLGYAWRTRPLEECTTPRVGTGLKWKCHFDICTWMHWKLSTWLFPVQPVAIIK